MEVSIDRGPQYRPQSIVILNIRTPKTVPSIVGKLHMRYRTVMPLTFPKPGTCRVVRIKRMDSLLQVPF